MSTTGFVNFQQNTPWPLAYGNVRGSGRKVIEHQLSDGSYIAFFLQGEGPWSGIEYVNINSGAFEVGGGAPGDTSGLLPDNFYASAGLSTRHLLTMHFHPGLDGVLGAGLAPTSTGGDQGVDALWSLLPSVVTPSTFSKRAYLGVQYTPPSTDTTSGVNLLGDFQTMLCRTYDGSGTFISNVFTTNPAWQILDLILRRAVKPDFLIGDGLLEAEAACIDFESFFNASVICDTILANGRKRFEGNYAFTGNSQVAAILETMLLNCRGYLRERGGVISLNIDKPRASQFVLSSNHVPANNLQVNEDNIFANGNRYIAQFKDTNVPGVANIASVSVTSGSTLTIVFEFDDPHPFGPGDFVIGTGIAGYFATTTIGGIVASITEYSLTINQGFGDAGTGTGTGGVMGLPKSRFADRTATRVVHQQHQQALATRSIGMTGAPKIVDVTFDFGSCTYDQSNRILQFERNRDLGPDVTPWIAPKQIQLQPDLEAVDINGNLLIQLDCGAVISIDDKLSFEFAGDYEVLEMTIYPATLQVPTTGQLAGTVDLSSTSSPVTQIDENGGTIELLLQTYYPANDPDVSDADDALFTPVTGPAFYGGGAANSTYEVVAGSITSSVSGSLATITATGVQIQVAGALYTCDEADTTFSGLPQSTEYAVYVDDPLARGGQPLQITTDFSILNGYGGRMFIGFITTPSTSGGGGGGGGGIGIGGGNNPYRTA